MKKYLLPSVFSLFVAQATAQNVAINSTGAAPDVSAMLDVSATNKGFLIPRMSSAQRTAIATPAQGLTVYDNTTNTYWYYNGTVWTEIGLNNGWRTTGNAGTNIATNFLGTTDGMSIGFRTNNTERMRIFATGEVAVGSTTAFGGDVFSAYGNYPISGYGNGASSMGVWGESNGATGGGVIGYNANTTGTGMMASGNNQTLSYLVAGSGGSFTGTANGVYAYSTTTGIGQAVYSSQFGTVVRVNYWNGATQFKINGAGSVSTIVKDLNEEEVTMYCPESPEIFFTDYGQGQLVNGKAHIELDPIFAKNVTINEKHPLRVFVQLEGDCNGVYITNKTSTGFDVVELQGGNSNTSFQWNVVCNRADEVLKNGRVSQNADVRFQKANPDEAVQTIQSQKQRIQE